MAAKLAVVVRSDLGMGRGKIAAQAAHAAVAATLANLGGPDFTAWLRDGRPAGGVAAGRSPVNREGLTPGRR